LDEQDKADYDQEDFENAGQLQKDIVSIDLCQ
jgi:hypothetical protein